MGIGRPEKEGAGPRPELRPQPQTGFPGPQGQEQHPLAQSHWCPGAVRHKPVTYYCKTLRDGAPVTVVAQNYDTSREYSQAEPTGCSLVFLDWDQLCGMTCPHHPLCVVSVAPMAGLPVVTLQTLIWFGLFCVSDQVQDRA